MTRIDQVTGGNRLLRMLSAEDFEAVWPHLHAVDVSLKQILIPPNQALDHLYFPQVGFVSVTVEIRDCTVEVGLIGREGLVGGALMLLGVDRSPYTYVVQMPGTMLRIGVAALQALMDEHPSLARLLLRFVHIELLQARQIAFVNASFVTEVRLARWLLMCHDRVDGDEIAITHEFLSMMLGVRRGGVTLALQNLEGEGRIRSRRGRVTVTDRDGLVAFAGGSYGTTEREYARLMAG